MSFASNNSAAVDLGKPEFSGLQLKAHDEEGCDVISSLLQDSILHISSHSFHEERKCLRLMLNRFCWELLNKENDAHSDSHQYFRVHSGLYIHNVVDIIINDNFKKVTEERYLNLLALHASKNEINLLFSGHKQVCLKISGISVHLKDLHQKYPTTVYPNHTFQK